MGRVAVVTDTVANLPDECYRELGIRVVPQIVIFGEESLREGVDLTVADFYRRFYAADPLPITSRPTPQSYLEAFQACGDAGDILVLTPSARLSGAYDAAQTAVREFGRPVTVIDTRTVALAQGFLVLEAARLARTGAPLADVVARVEQLRSKVALYGAIPTLKYLQRTGRVGRAAAAVGSLLQVKPIITVGDDGVVDTADRVRSWPRALQRLLELMEADRPGPRARLHVGVMHADAAGEAERLNGAIAERFSPVESYFTYFTPAVATHTGPGLVGVAYWWE